MNPASESNPHRLPRTVVPSHYRLHLRPDIDAAVFEGRVDVSVSVAEPTTSIVLNAIELDLTSATVVAGAVTAPAEVSLDEATERATLRFDEPIPAGDASLQIEFTGTLNDKLRGFYRSTYTDDDGTEHTIATTQFESTNARRCFPCWDEPDFKAVYEVTLVVPEDLLAVSAMQEVARTDAGDGHVSVEFAPTPVMSTYLLAFVVGRLEASPPIDVDGVPLRMIHRPGQGERVAFGLDAAEFCLRWLTDYFGVPYFGDKIDLLAIPDFAFGAMENTGCVTFREALLLIDPDATTQPEQLRAVAVIAHELAHMWFGNLVTMQWWEGLWLKEAFATFMETSATDAYRPDWKVWDSFAIDRSAAYDVDALHSTRAIEYEVQSPADAEGMYDVLTYEKGASVVRMLEQFVGPERFRSGIRSYMETHAFGNTVTADLWNAIGAATDLPVDEIMHEWIYVGGFPLVRAELDGDELTLEQSPFRLLDDHAATTDEPEWKVPVSVAHGSDSTAALLVPNGRIQLADPGDPVIVDPDGNGFFRVHYGPTLAGRLGENLMQLTSSQRYAIIDDFFELVLARRAEVSDYVRLAREVRGETLPAVWSSLASGFATLAHVAEDRDARNAVGDCWAGIAGSELEALGLDRPDGETDPLLNEVRATLYTSLGSLSRLPEVVADARAVVSGERATANASIEGAAVRVVGSTGDRADFEEFFARFKAAASPQIERRYLFALPRFDDPGIIDDLCGHSIDGSIRSQDAAFVLGLALGNRWHGGRAWQFVTDEWDRILDYIPENGVGRMLAGIQWLEHHDVDAVARFIEAHPVPQARLSIAQRLERLRIHDRLRSSLSGRLAGQLA